MKLSDLLTVDFFSLRINGDTKIEGFWHQKLILILMKLQIRLDRAVRLQLTHLKTIINLKNDEIYSMSSNPIKLFFLIKDRRKRKTSVFKKCNTSSNIALLLSMLQQLPKNVLPSPKVNTKTHK